MQLLHIWIIIILQLKNYYRLCPGPDFPTGGIVANKSDLKDIYENGTGKLKLRGKLEFEKGKGREKDKLVITEIPYTMIGAGIGKFISDVIDLVETKRQQTLLTFQTAQMKTVFVLF